MALRDALLASLADLPGTRDFHLHVLLSSPRKHSGLFPYAHPRPRTYLQDIFVLLSEQPPGAPRVLVTALEAAVYHLPSTASALLYLSKVDSSGHAAAPSPTAPLVRALVAFYADPATRPLPAAHLWVHLFARAQPQYLFPNSADWPGKRPLAGAPLCAWWQRILADVAAAAPHGTRVALHYLLPGLTELEAVHALAAARSRPLPEGAWTYGHHCAQTGVPLPCPPAADGARGLAHLVPWFDDDPKARFLDELAHLAGTAHGVRSPQPKRAKTGGGEKRADEDRAGAEEHARQGEVARVSVDEFWERMSFRQECSAGVVTGFFALGLSTPLPDAPAPPPLAPQPGQVPPAMVRRVVATLMNHHEFSTAERAARATATLEDAIRGLCEDLRSAPTAPDPTATPDREFARALEEAPRTPPRRPRALAVPSSAATDASFDEPVASLETYRAHIFGALAVDNPPRPRAAAAAPAPAVTVLAARKKRKAGA